MDEKLKELYERLAGMLAYKVPASEIQEAFGLTGAQYDAVINSAEFREILLLETNKLISDVSLDQAWDNLEKEALKKVQTTMDFSMDPEYALKAAMLANRAKRKLATDAQKPLPITEQRVQIILSNSLVANMQIAPLPAMDQSMALEHKEIDVATPTDVERYLYLKEEKALALTKIVDMAES